MVLEQGFKKGVLNRRHFYGPGRDGDNSGYRKKKADSGLG